MQHKSENSPIKAISMHKHIIPEENTLKCTPLYGQQEHTIYNKNILLLKTLSKKQESEVVRVRRFHKQ